MAPQDQFCNTFLEILYAGMDPSEGVGVSTPPPQLGSRPKLGGARGVEILTKMCKKTKVLLKNEGKIVIQEKSFACGEQLS